MPDGRDSPSRGQNWNTGLNLVFSRCDSGGGSLLLSTRLNRCADRLKLHWVTQYQPASHFWALQTAETAIFVAAAIVLCGITVLSGGNGRQLDASLVLCHRHSTVWPDRT